MAFKDFPDQEQGVGLLQRSLERGRLAHAYLFTGHDLSELEAIAQTLAKTLNCLQPVHGQGSIAIDCCDQCVNCNKIAMATTPMSIGFAPNPSRARSASPRCAT
jgi:DNA polymerase III gamma/tau subunit